jgi:hypothetical protein
MSPLGRIKLWTALIALMLFVTASALVLTHPPMVSCDCASPSGECVCPIDHGSEIILIGSAGGLALFVLALGFTYRPRPSDWGRVGAQTGGGAPGEGKASAWRTSSARTVGPPRKPSRGDERDVGQRPSWRVLRTLGLLFREQPLGWVGGAGFEPA